MFRQKGLEYSEVISNPNLYLLKLVFHLESTALTLVLSMTVTIKSWVKTQAVQGPIPVQRVRA